MPNNLQPIFSPKLTKERKLYLLDILKLEKVGQWEVKGAYCIVMEDDLTLSGGHIVYYTDPVT